MTETILDAVATGVPQWEAVIRQLDWPPLVVAAGYVLAATLCVGVGNTQPDERGGWFAAAALLALIGVNTVLRLDLLGIYVIRALARAQGWYQERRTTQVLVVGTLAAFALALAGWLRTQLASAWARCAPAPAGIGLLVALFGLRLVSFHDTDRLLAPSVAGVSVGRFLEGAGLVLTAVGAWRRARG